MITLIVAVADSNVIGWNNTLPWHLPDDLRHFKRQTLGKPVLMGRKTCDSLGKPLPGRKNIVLTRDPNYHRDGVTVVHGIDAALQAAGDAPEVMVIGGAELFRALQPRAGRVYLTRVHGSIVGDVFWPPLDPRDWQLTASESQPVDERHAYAMTFEVWDKRQA
jgi:dihydrofolate reductase